MQVVIIGSGNVATVLGRAIKNAGHTVLQVYSRGMADSELLANELLAEPICDLQKINNEADFYIMAISDTAIPGIARKLHLLKGVLIHTAGAVSKNALQKAAVQYGVLYPLQSVRKEKMDYWDIPLLVDGNAANVIVLIEDFSKTLSSYVSRANDEERLKLHLAAVVVSNLTNYLYALAEDYCQRENISFKMLQPLIAETANRLQTHHAAEMQTGPAIRKDTTTVDKHIELLMNYPDLQAVYCFLSDKILKSEGF